MAVSPDLLLNIKAPTAAAKAANAHLKQASQSSRDEPSSFANVYAKERQAKPAERQDSAVKSARDKPASEKPSHETAKQAAAKSRLRPTPAMNCLPNPRRSTATRRPPRPNSIRCCCSAWVGRVK